jgi:hypothetical protein
MLNKRFNHCLVDFIEPSIGHRPEFEQSSQLLPIEGDRSQQHFER